jgi:hypothetical protein
MTDILDMRLPLMHSAVSIALRDVYTAPDTYWVPLTYGGVTCRANELVNLPAHARIPVLYGGMQLTPADVIAAQVGGGDPDLLALEDGTGHWEWEDGTTINWPQGGPS